MKEDLAPVTRHFQWLKSVKWSGLHSCQGVAVAQEVAQLIYLLAGQWFNSPPTPVCMLMWWSSGATVCNKKEFECSEHKYHLLSWYQHKFKVCYRGLLCKKYEICCLSLVCKCRMQKLEAMFILNLNVPISLYLLCTNIIVRKTAALSIIELTSLLLQVPPPHTHTQTCCYYVLHVTKANVQQCPDLISQH